MVNQNHIKPQLWRLFLDLAEMGSLSQLANAWDTSQPQLSRQLAELEDLCGAPLFNRHGRGMTLSEIGQWCYPKVKDLLNQSDQLEQDIRTNAGNPIGQVRIACIPSTVQAIILPVIQKANQLYPKVKLIVQEALDSQMDERLKSDNFDLALRYINNKHIRDSDEILFETDSYLVGPKGDKVTKASRIDFKSIAHLNLILPCRPSMWRDHLDDLAAQQGFKLNVTEQADSLIVQKTLTQNKNIPSQTMHTILGPLALRSEIENKTLQASRIVNPNIKRSVAITGNKNRHQSLAQTVIKDLIKTQAKEIFGDFDGISRV
jgi:DNA-binding transcriptional LysR family regulator